LLIKYNLLSYFSRTYHIWSGKAHLPSEKEIFYRYFIAYIVEPDLEHEYVKQKHIFVNSWESHYEPRTLGGIFIIIVNYKLSSYL